MKHLIGTLALTTLACAPACAQSSVTLSGIMDLAARRVSNSGVDANNSLVSGGNSTSRLIFRGSEDLGGGLSAGFHLEHGIAADVGAGTGTTQFWDRRSTLSLVSTRWGELRLGRDFVPSYVNWSRYDPFSYVGVAGANNLVSASQTGPIRAAFASNPNTTVRSSNAVQYLLPSGLGGVEGGVMLAAREGGTAAAGQDKVVGARLGWANSKLGVSAAYTATTNDLTVLSKFKDLAVGASAELGEGIRLSAGWRRFDYGDAQQTNLLLGASVPMGTGAVKLSWNRASMDGRVGTTVINDNGVDQFGLGYVYTLSKRSVLYGTLAVQSNDGKSTFTIPGGTPGITAGGNSRGIELGVRHSF